MSNANANANVSHPSGLALEAFAVGEKKAIVASHLEECAVCTAHVERLRGALSAGPSKSKAAEMVARAAAKVAETKVEAQVAVAEPTNVRSIGSARSRWIPAASVVLPLAIAAAVLLFLRGPSKETAHNTPPAASSIAMLDPIPSKTTDQDPGITFKGGIQIAVIRDRDGRQERFMSAVPVKPGDRLRVEVALDREQAILAAVLGDDSSWLELMTEGVRRPGTHFSERSARVDADPLRGTILVGTPEAVARARQTKRFEGVSVVRIEWEAAP